MRVFIAGIDGYLGWPEAAPFDAILVTAAPEEIPETLIDQLAEGGVLVVPVGPQSQVQTLLKLTKINGQIKEEQIIPVRFVPMVHEEEQRS